MGGISRGRQASAAPMLARAGVSETSLQGTARRTLASVISSRSPTQRQPHTIHEGLRFFNGPFNATSTPHRRVAELRRGSVIFINQNQRFQISLKPTSTCHNPPSRSLLPILSVHSLQHFEQLGSLPGAKSRPLPLISSVAWIKKKPVCSRDQYLPHHPLETPFAGALRAHHALDYRRCNQKCAIPISPSTWGLSVWARGVSEKKPRRWHRIVLPPITYPPRSKGSFLPS
jgi:hypothetical protein